MSLVTRSKSTFCQDSFLTAFLGSSITSVLNLDHVSSFYQPPLPFWFLPHQSCTLRLLKTFDTFTLFCMSLLTSLRSVRMPLTIQAPIFSRAVFYTNSESISNISFWGCTHRRHVQSCIICNSSHPPRITLMSEFLTHLLVSHFNFLKLVAVFYT